MKNKVTEPAKPTPARSVAFWLIAATILIVFAGILAVEVTYASRRLSATWDEPYNLLAGLTYWQQGDFGVNPEHPPLTKLVATLPLLPLHLLAPYVANNASRPNCTILARELIFSHDADAILFRSRLAIGCFALLLILLLFESGYRLFGPQVGLLAGALALFEPNLLAHSALVTADFGLACFYFAAVYALWRVAERATPIRLVSCGIACGLALATKYIGILLIPTVILLVGEEMVSRSRRARRDPGDVLLRQAFIWSARLAVVGAVALATIWGFYRFEYRARPEGLTFSPPLSTTLMGLGSHVTRPIVSLATEYQLLPEGYLYGLSDTLALNSRPRTAFLLGHLFPHASWYYFPVTVLIKSTLGFLILLGIALATAGKWTGASHRRALYLLLPPALFLSYSLTSGTNMGIRHILPIYPFLILASAAGAWELAKRRKGWAVLVAALVGFHIVSSALRAPNYLAYSNELFGGTSKTYRSLSDSNVDWGQGLTEARNYLASRNITDCWMAYYGSADPRYYQVPCKMLPEPYLWWWRAPAPIPPEKFHGTVLISATELSAAEWGPEELNPYSQFLGSRPAAVLGGSILVYNGDTDLTPAAAQAHMTAGWDLYRSGRIEGGVDELRQAEELAPQHPGPPSMLGNIYADTGRVDEARAQLTIALRLAQAEDPDFHSIWLDMVKSQINALN